MNTDKRQILDVRDKRWLKLLFTPSWISLLVCICCALGLLIGVLFASQYKGTSYQQQVAEIRSKQVNAHYSSEDAEFEGLEGNTFIDVVPVVIMWGIIGIVIYFFAVAIVQSLQHAAEFKSELEYVNASRNEMLKAAFVHLGIRTAVGVLWILFVIFFFGQIIPYAVNAALAVSALGLNTEAFLYALICLTIVSLSIHLHTIFLRLLVLKPRVFSKALYLN